MPEGQNDKLPEHHWLQIRGTKLLSGPTPEGRKKYIWKGLKRFTFLGNKIGWIVKNKNHLKGKWCLFQIKVVKVLGDFNPMLNWA